jgi:hypothetical protein
MCLLISLSLPNDFTLPNLFNTHVDGLKVLGLPLLGGGGGHSLYLLGTLCIQKGILLIPICK